MILRTAAYMAPEQARGKAVDKRADIWAFGVVLYEMLTGEQLFQGETVSDTLAAVLTREPDLTRVPVKVRRLLQLCLQKDPKQRLQAIGDWRLLLEDAPARAPKPKSSLVWPAIAGALAISLAIALWAPWRAKRDLQPLVRLDVDLGSDVSLSSFRGNDAILSPDGARIVYFSNSRLFTRRLDQAKAAELAGTEGAWAPFFSPDGQWVAFFTPGKLKKVPVQGGAPISLCNVPYGSGGSWGEDGNIVASSASISGLWRVPSGGGAPTRIAELATGEAVHRWPQILPGGKAALFTASTSAYGVDGANIVALSLSDGRRKTLQRGGMFGRFLPSGHLVYLHNGTLFAVPFDLDRLETQGTPVPVLEEVAYETRFGSAQFDFSRAGTLLYRSGGAGSQTVKVQWLDGGGKAQPLLIKPRAYTSPRLSSDGSRLALTSAEGPLGLRIAAGDDDPPDSAVWST
jgi:serine/threonine-protein kinase